MSNEKPRRHAHVANIDELEAMELTKGSKFGAQVKRLGHATSAMHVGCSWYEVPPGRTAFPFHYHCGVDEAMYVLEGEGTLRIGEDRVPIRAGDWATFHAGPDAAHQVINTSDAPLRYLCLSNHAQADVIAYPDSNKVAAFGSGQRDYFAPAWVRGRYKADATVDYYDGEEID